MLSVRRLSSLLSLSKNTVSKSLKELEDRGLIICYPREGNSLTADKEGSLSANVEGKAASSSAFWFADLELRETASKQMREEKKDACDKGARYNVYRGEGSLKRPEGGSREGSFTANKGGSKYAKFF